MALGNLLNQTFSVKPANTTRGKHGEAGLGAAQDVRGRFERKSSTILNQEREVEPIDGVFITGPDDDFPIGSQVTYAGQTYRLMTKADAPGGDGQIHHIEYKCQLWSYDT